MLWHINSNFAAHSQSMKNTTPLLDHFKCTTELLPTRDTVELLAGKWKILILMVLAIRGRTRFMEMVREIGAITPKMLSKELRHLEQNHLVSRTVQPTIPVTVEYELTDYGHTLRPVIAAMRDWGITHRERITGKAGKGAKRKVKAAVAA